MALSTLPPSHSSALRMISAGMAANTALMKNIIKCAERDLESRNSRSAGVVRRLLAARIGRPEIVSESGGARLGFTFPGRPLACFLLPSQCSWKILCTLIRREREFDAGHAGSLLKALRPGPRRPATAAVYCRSFCRGETPTASGLILLFCAGNLAGRGSLERFAAACTYDSGLPEARHPVPGRHDPDGRRQGLQGGHRRHGGALPER